LNSLVIEHLRRNANSRSYWDTFAPHRRRVTELLLADRPRSGGRLAVLGAGNCNDLELDQLATAFDEVHLFDLDGAALADAVARQLVPQSDMFRLHGGVDVTGIVDELARCCADEPPQESGALNRLIASATSGGPALGGPFDVVVSACLLTQLIDTVRLAIGDRHPRLVDFVLAVRDRHLRLLAELLAPGGRGVLVTDIVSSDTCPELMTLDESDLLVRLRQWVARGNFFTGANPFVLAARFGQDDWLKENVTDVRLDQPWIWQIGPRAYVVCAITFTRGPLVA